ncbi:MAG: DEAD/DEAH box helicase [Patescibacteria group bacterium]|jgi:ATP-dependent RNA helicase RhlE
MSTTATPATFADLGIAPAVLRLLQQRHINIPTPIQHQALPPVLQGHDVIGLAQTGTGKTLVFVLPTVMKLAQNPGQALILVPTRELAQQVADVWQWFERDLRLPYAVVIGGAGMGAQISALKRRPRCIIATPGRLLDHLRQRTVNLQAVNTLILDEADRMFDMGFAPQIKDILKHVVPPAQRQTLLFSATMPSSIRSLVTQSMRTPVSIEVAPSGTTAENIEQEFVVVGTGQKNTAIFELIADKNTTALIFTRTKHGAKRLTQVLREKGWRAEELHSNRSLFQRKQALAALQSKRSKILVATDIAGRGIDIAHLDVVINYDLPEQAEDYVHRIGRVGRAGRMGKAISLVAIDQSDLFRRIQRFTTKPMTQRKMTSIETIDLPAASSHPAGRKSFGGRSFGGRRGGFSGRRSGGSVGHRQRQRF